MEHRIKMDYLGVQLFSETPIYLYHGPPKPTFIEVLGCFNGK